MSVVPKYTNPSRGTAKIERLSGVFMMMVRVGYPTETEETMILAAATGGHRPGIDPVVTPEELEDVRGEVERVEYKGLYYWRVK